MALIRVNAEPRGLVWHQSGQVIDADLATVAAGDGAIIIMVHGFKFTPGDPRHCPHDHILSDHDNHACWKAASWPRALGLAAAEAPLGLAFGWPARGTIWQAYAAAEGAGLALARLILQLRQVAPQRPIRAIAHSLGARVVLSALAHLPAGALQRAVLLTPAEFQQPATAALTTAAGRSAEILTVSSRENRLFERLLETALPLGRAIGRDGPEAPRALTLRLDDPTALAGLARIGHPIAAPERRICHWSSYLRPGAFALYSALLRPPDPLPFEQLRHALPAPNAPTEPAPMTAMRRNAVSGSLPARFAQ